MSLRTPFLLLISIALGTGSLLEDAEAGDVPPDAPSLSQQLASKAEQDSLLLDALRQRTEERYLLRSLKLSQSSTVERYDEARETLQQLESARVRVHTRSGQSLQGLAIGKRIVIPGEVSTPLWIVDSEHEWNRLSTVAMHGGLTVLTLPDLEKDELAPPTLFRRESSWPEVGSILLAKNGEGEPKMGIVSRRPTSYEEVIHEPILADLRFEDEEAAGRPVVDGSGAFAGMILEVDATGQSCLATPARIRAALAAADEGGEHNVTAARIQTALALRE